MSPPCPDGMNTVQASQFDDQGHIGIVVIVAPAWDVDDDVSHANVFGIGAADNNECGDCDMHSIEVAQQEARWTECELAVKLTMLK